MAWKERIEIENSPQTNASYMMERNMTQVAVNAAKGSSQTVLGQIAEEDPGLLTGIVAFQSFACVLGKSSMRCSAQGKDKQCQD